MLSLAVGFKENKEFLQHRTLVRSVKNTYNVHFTSRRVFISVCSWFGKVFSQDSSDRLRSFMIGLLHLPL